jgi:hypothetical protein
MPTGGHRHQDQVKRVVIDQFLDLDGDLVALGPQRGQLRGELGQHDPSGLGAGDHHALLAQRAGDLGGQPLGQARGALS